MNPASRILLVDDDLNLLQALPETVRMSLAGVEVDTAESAPDALEHLSATDYDTVITDMDMAGLDAVDLLTRIRDLRPDVPTLLITGNAVYDLILQALRAGAYDFIQKPIDRDYFIVSLQRAIDARRLRREIEDQRRALEAHASQLERAVVERGRPGFTAADDREHRIAETFQRAFLPPALPTLPGIDLSAAYTPGSLETEIGGDWYDAFRLPDGRLVVSVGDVAGKGLQAAVKMSQVRGAIRATMFHSASPAEPLEVAHRLLCLDDAPHMTTALVGIVDPQASTFTYASAGHAGPIVATLQGSATFLPSTGIALGTPQWSVPREGRIELAPGTMLVLYTDGLVEAKRDIIGGERALHDAVRATLDERIDLPAKAIQERVLAGVRQPDDVAILVVQINHALAPRLDVTVPATKESFRGVLGEIARLGDRLHLDAETTFTLKVAVGEAVTNVIEHAYAERPGPMRVIARHTDGELTITIQDSGRWRTWRPEGRGRGLRIIRALAGAVELDTSARGTTLTIHMPLGGHHPHDTLTGRTA